MKIGLEMEYWIVDKEGELVSSKELAEKIESAEQEFVEPMLELKTSPHEDIENLRAETVEILRQALSEARKLEQRIVSLGTPLNSREISMLESRRGEIQQKIIGENLEAAKRVAGTHIHFEKENVMEQLNILTAMDPALALMNSSPYYRGEKLASSSRNQVYRYRCYRNLPQHGQLWEYVDSVEEWEERINRRFEKFKESGKDNSISKKEIKEHFNLYDALWTPVRLRKEFPTVEWRAPDTGNIENALRLAEESKQIVEKASEGELEFGLLKFEKLERLSRKAIKNGIDDREVRDYLEKLGFKPQKYEKCGIDLGQEMTVEKAKKVRLNQAKKLEESEFLS